MKKILLLLMFICAFASLRAQTVVLNEIYGNPGGTNSEFIELYNSSASGSLDCYTILVYFENEGGTNKGWYVLDLPNTPNIGASPAGFYVLAPQSPFSVQGTAGATAQVNWNALTFRNGSTGGYLKKYIQTGGTNATATYTEDGTFTNSTAVTNLLDGTLNGSQFYFVLLYRNGILINGFVGGGASGVLSTYSIPLGTLNITPTGACAGTFNAFGNLGTVEFHNPSGGNDNGYARTSDGKCGSWTKTANQGDHTPGLTNGSASGDLGELGVTQIIRCDDQYPNTPGIQRAIEADVAFVSGSATEAEDFPITIEFYYDPNFDGELNDGLLPFDTKVQTTVAQAAVLSAALPDINGDYIVVYKTARGCFDRVAPLASACASLPVKLSLFTAARYQSNVSLIWETATEINNAGFYVQRLIGGGSWETIGFVPSQAAGGNSNSLLHYEFIDNNSTKGMTQYRLRQVDIDGKSAMSSIRTVRGEGQNSNTVIYPNPSKGKVNVIFESSNSNSSRDVTLMDMNGRTIKQWKNITGNTLQIENLVTGFYTVRIINNQTGEQVIEKIVVQSR
jgi:hypothetical protein